MDKDRLFFLIQCFKSENPELINPASEELMRFCSTPESLPVLSSLYFCYNDSFFKKMILIGINKALNDENLSNINNEQLQIFQDNIVLMVTKEVDQHLLSEIESFFFTILNKFKRSWPSLDNYIYTNPSFPTPEYFYIFNLLVSKIKTEEDCDEIIEFSRSKLQILFQNVVTFQAKLSAFCFIATISLKMNHQFFLWEFTESFKNFFRSIFTSQDHFSLQSFIQVLYYIEDGLCTADFTKQICCLNEIIDYCLSPGAYYSNCIHFRIFINKSLIVSELELSDLLEFIPRLILLSKKLYSNEIDVQTQQIDDYFPILKYIPINQRKDFCFFHIQNLIQENQPASICTALSLFRGSIISEVVFDQKPLDFFLQCYNINHLGVKIVAASTLVDICEELSIEIERNSSVLLEAFCSTLKSSIELPIEAREQLSLAVFDVMKPIILFCDCFNDVSSFLLPALMSYAQNGTQMEQYQALLNLMHIIQKSSKIALIPDVYNCFYHFLQTKDPSLRELIYDIFTIYIELYPKVINVDAIIASISNEPECEYYVCVNIIGSISLQFSSNDQVKEFIMSQIRHILAISEGNDAQYSQADHRGYAISTLFYIMSVFTEIVPSLLPSVIESIANIIMTKSLNNSVVNSIEKGIDQFSSVVNKSNEKFTPELFYLIFYQIKENLSCEWSIDDNLFDILYFLTNFIELKDFPEIDQLTAIAIKRFSYLMKIDRKESIKGIQSTSNFIRNVFMNYTSEMMNSMGGYLVGRIFEQLTTKQSSSVLEGHLILLLSAVAMEHIDCFNDCCCQLTEFLVMKMKTSIPNTAKNIAYFFNSLASANALKQFCNENKENLNSLWNSLCERLTPPQYLTPTLQILNDNIVSALISIEKAESFVEFNQFYALISPFLPSYSDSDELFNIYSSLIDSFQFLNDQNKDHFVVTLIKFFSFSQSTAFFNAISYSNRNELFLIMNALIKRKLDSTENSELFINSIVQDEEGKIIFTRIFNYISTFALQIISQGENQG